MFEILVNPSGASGKTMQALKEVEDYCKKKDVAYHINISKDETHFKDLTQTLTNQEVDLILIGGDGTLNVFINHVKDFNHLHLGFIPCGSGNDFAKSLGISKNIKNELDKIIERKIRRQLDIGIVSFDNQFDKNNQEVNLFQTKVFNNGCGIGFTAEICEKAESHLGLKKFLNKIGLGKLIYLTVAMRLVFTIEKANMKVYTDDNEGISFDDVWFIACMNEPYEGGGFKFGPNANANDNEFEICVAYSLPLSAFFRFFPLAYKGKHIEKDGVEILHGKHVVIESDKPMWVQYDGEFDCKTTRMQLDFIEDKLQILN